VRFDPRAGLHNALLRGADLSRDLIGRGPTDHVTGGDDVGGTQANCRLLKPRRKLAQFR